MTKSALLLAVLLAAPPAGAQTQAPTPATPAPAAFVYPRFETRAADSGARCFSGTEMLAVGTAAVRLPLGATLAVRLSSRPADEPLRTDRFPATFRYDTAKETDGWHWVELVATDGTPNAAPRVIDSLKVYVRNNAATPLPPAPVATPVLALPAAPPAPAAAPRRVVALASRRGSRRRGAETPPALPPPVAAPVGGAAAFGTLDAVVAPSANPLDVPRVSILCKTGDLLCLGLPDGGVAVWNERTKQGRVARIAALTPAPVRALAASPTTIYWTAGQEDTVYVWHLQTNTVVAFDASAPAPGFLTRVGTGGPRASDPLPVRTAPAWVTRIGMVGGRVLLMGTATARFLEADGTLHSPVESLPAPVADAYVDGVTPLFVGAAGVRGTTLLLATPDASGEGASLRVLAGMSDRARRLRERGTLSTGANLSQTPPAVTAFGIVLPDAASGSSRTNVVFVSVGDQGDSLVPIPIPLGVSGDGNDHAPQGADFVSCGANGVWWARSGIVFTAEPVSGKRACYLPWNGAGGRITALLADGEGAYVATDRGVRRIVPNAPTDADGYGGYVCAPLGDETAAPPDETAQIIAENIEQWQGVVYKWGGQMMTGTDCSGFVGAMHAAAGVTIPRTSEEMGKTRQGIRVKGDLRYGDTLVYPGHVALYIGNGRTAETVGGTGTGSVGKATIWRRREVVVKRFLP